MHAPTAPLINPQLLLTAYRSGIFPMADSRGDEDVFWIEPRERAILPLDGFRCSRSLAKALRQGRFTVTLDSAFAQTVAGCAEPRPEQAETWISERIEASYHLLHARGHAHSVECWRGYELVGGLYGVAFDAVFCGESMFSRADNASKVALAWLVALMRRAGYALLDCQFMTPHLASLGAVTISREEYLQRLHLASEVAPAMSLPRAYASLLAESASSEGTGASSSGKLIAQSLTHRS